MKYFLPFWTMILFCTHSLAQTNQAWLVGSTPDNTVIARNNFFSKGALAPGLLDTTGSVVPLAIGAMRVRPQDSLIYVWNGKLTGKKWNVIGAVAAVTSVNGLTGAVTLTIPTNTNQLTNGAGFITSAGAPVQSVNGQIGAVTINGSITYLGSGDTHIIVSGAGTSGAPYSVLYNPTNKDSLKGRYIDTGSVMHNNYVLAYDSTNRKWYLTVAGGGAGGVTSFNTRTGIVVLTTPDVTTALGYTPEDVANKATSTSLGTSNTLYPSQNAVKVYVDNGLATKQATGNYITALTGDVGATGPGSATATIQPSAVTTTKINNNAITYAKIQPASAQSLLGATGVGNFQEITLGTNLSMTGSTLNAAGGGGGGAFASLTDVSLTNPFGLSTPGNNQVPAYDTSLIKWTNRWFQETGNPAYWRAVDSFHVYGMSIAAGASASVPDSAYPKRVSVATGSPFINHAQGGATVPNVVYQYWLFHSSIDNTKNCIVDIGVNELGASPSPAKLQSLIEGLNVVSANQLLHTVVYANNMTKTGVWTNLGSGSDTIISKSTIQGGLPPVKSTTPGSTLSTTVNGPVIVVGGWGCDVNQTLGSYTIAVDGTVAKTVNPIGRGINYFYNVLLAVNFRRPMVTVISGLGSGTHTVTITTSSSTEVDIDYVGSLNANYNTKAMIINHVLKSNNAGYTLDGGNSSDLTVDSANNKIDSLVGTYRNMGYYTLRSVPNENTFNIYTGLSGDGLHPNDVGHYQDFVSIFSEINTGRANTYYTQGNGVSVDSFRHVSLSGNYAGTLNIRNATADYTNTSGANSHIVLSNPLSSGQSSISFLTNEVLTNKIRGDAAGNLTLAAYLNGDHIFNVLGDYPGATNVMNVTHSNTVTVPTGSVIIGGTSLIGTEPISIQKNSNSLNLPLIHNASSGNAAASGMQFQVGSESGYFYRTSNTYSLPARQSSMYFQEPTGAVVLFTSGEALAVDHSKNVTITNLATGSTPPTTSGLLKMTVSDANGLLSSQTINAGAGTKSIRYNPATGVFSYVDTTAGGSGTLDTLKSVNAGSGLNSTYILGTDTLASKTLKADNGLTGTTDPDSTNHVVLGGALTQTTTIAQGSKQMIFKGTTTLLNLQDNSSVVNYGITPNGSAPFYFNLGWATLAGAYTRGSALLVDTFNNVYTTSGTILYPGYSSGNSLVVGGNLVTSGAKLSRYLLITTSQSLGLSNNIIYVDATSGNVTVTLPSVASVSTLGSSTGFGVLYTIKRIDASGNTVTVSRAGSDLIDGATSFTLASFATKTIQAANSTNWYIQ